MEKLTVKAALPTSQRATRLSIGAIFAALCAGIIMFDAVLALGIGLDWAIIGLLHLSESFALAGGVVALALAALSGVWLFRRACEAERELAQPDAAA